MVLVKLGELNEFEPIVIISTGSPIPDKLLLPITTLPFDENAAGLFDDPNITSLDELEFSKNCVPPKIILLEPDDKFLPVLLPIKIISPPSVIAVVAILLPNITLLLPIVVTLFNDVLASMILLLEPSLKSSNKKEPSIILLSTAELKLVFNISLPITKLVFELLFNPKPI